ncbi:TrmH family RNA methyltransferase [Thermosporothrix hazakensis]|jgi:TrmH family RNA methyltransferase|uniref:TrmH family RNA methyltransferase n=2 Tax=Thermosporothrix TaxID=768650 RepID=A0A326U376_THEHA|nr:TrmH family RNA methyltransferase [Thermosporothrix hazakensis]PZW26354.1 TrmH family RNA methyltransferase [Thermosporothrix hazakensis]BBH90644.1 hypothetical protein KTC_53950 [Thermosporothrix sp. COM3]GCE48695.1 hypothetical protein KTH_35640 [Thermosporothrix hazakensis]
MKATSLQITSIKDPKVVEARELHSASGRQRHQKCLLEGSDAIRWALEAHFPLEHVFFSPEHERHELQNQLTQARIPCYTTSDGVLKKISETTYLIPYLAVARIPAEPTSTMGDFILVLDRVVDHGNIGTIIRTASAFGIRDIVSTTPDLDLFYKKIIDASRGRVFETHVKRYRSDTETVADLKRRGYQIIATSPHARELQAMAPLQAKPIALIVGNETEGISREIEQQADILIQIPMSGQVESLNVGVATGISLYELKFRMVLTMLIHYIRSNIGREVNVTGRIIQQAFDAYIRRFSDLTGQQAILLMMLVCDQKLSHAEITRETGAFGDELTTLLTPLIEQGYARYTSDKQDEIAPTETAQRTLAQLWAVIERAEQAILDGFSEPEKQQFNDYLKRIQENCQRLLS